MAKKKYKFNPDTLSYERVGISWKERIYENSSLFLQQPCIVINYCGSVSEFI